MPDKRKAELRKVTINNVPYRLIEEVGRGAASVCYRAESGGKKFIVKEFCPIGISCRDRYGNAVPMDGQEDIFEAKKHSFAESARFQTDVLHSIQRNDFITVTDHDEKSGFIVMRDNDGETLADWAARQRMCDSYILTCIQLMNGIIDELKKYHSSGYVHLDLKVENIYKFNIENDQMLTRIFDFDSIQKIDRLYADIRNGCAHIHTTNDCYGPEINEINSGKAKHITRDMLVRLDYYAAARIFYYLLYGSCRRSILDDDSAFDMQYSGCALLRSYIDTMFKILFADIEKRTTDPDTMKEYFARIGFLLINGSHWSDFAPDKLSRNFKGSLMADIEADGMRYTRDHGITAIEQIVSKYERDIFLHGHDGGRGKTTAMKWLMFRKLSSPGELYMYVPLNRLEDSDIEQQILDMYHLNSMPDGTVLLLDGYNEIEEDTDDRKILEKLSVFLDNKRTDIRVIISGRDNAQLFGKLQYCRVIGLSEKELGRRRASMPYLSKELQSNPMIADLYTGIDPANAPKAASKRFIGKKVNGKIEVCSAGEALYNYFMIQIYTKSHGDTRAAEEYEEFLFEILPKIGVEELSERERRIFERCNNLFCLVEEDEDKMRFVHQNYRDFFSSIRAIGMYQDVIKSGAEMVPYDIGLNDITADLMGAAYCTPVVTETSVIVPRGCKASYYSPDKEIIESDEEVIYYGGRNMILEGLEAMRGKLKLDVNIVRWTIGHLPYNNMNYSYLNIGECCIYNGIFADITLSHSILDNEIEEFKEILFDHSRLFSGYCLDGKFVDCSMKKLARGSSIMGVYGRMKNERSYKIICRESSRGRGGPTRVFKYYLHSKNDEIKDGGKHNWQKNF